MHSGQIGEQAGVYCVPELPGGERWTLHNKPPKTLANRREFAGGNVATLLPISPFLETLTSSPTPDKLVGEDCSTRFCPRLFLSRVHQV